MTRAVGVVSSEWGSADRLLGRAETLAGAWGARAGVSTTAGQERALLRLFGVVGLDREGRPLAGEVVDRYLAGGVGRLSGGVVLPFAAALLEYDLAPQALALDVSAGTIDLGLEAELLRDTGRRAAAEAEAARFATSALDRIDANRTARRELVDVLGDAVRPWIGMPLEPADLDAAGAVIRGLVRDGADLVRVAVPAGRELTDRLHDAGVEVPGWRSFEDGLAEAGEPTPAGSQRGLAALRHLADEAAAERRGYVRLATTAPGLAAPEQAVVAAFERIDVAMADVVAEIIDERVDPDRALADHAFAHRLHRRAGSVIVVGPGPLVVAPDLARGVPSDPATRAGRALALQLVGIALARYDGLAADQVVAGALPGWLLDESGPAARAIAEVAMRRVLLPDHSLAFQEPASTGDSSAAALRWPFVLAAVLPYAGSAALILREVGGPATAGRNAIVRAAAAVAADVAASTGSLQLHGAALDHARATMAAADATLERLADIGWRAVLGQSVEGPHGRRLGADAVVERTESFMPFGD
jgi:D-lysine 5,6-aminomutase alpha subunit-like protein